MYARILLTVMLVTSVLAVPAAAQDDGGGGTTIIDLDGVIDAIEDLNEWVSDLFDEVKNWEKKLKELILSIIYEPVRKLAGILIEHMAVLISHTPSVEGNSAVEEVHEKTLFLAYAFAVLFIVGTGLLYMVGPIFGVSYGQAAATLPRIVVALMFATVSIPLLQLVIDITNQLVLAFSPGQLKLGLDQLLGLSAGVAIVAYIKAPLLLAVALFYIFRAVLILFLAAISPLIAVFWAIPKLSRYSVSLIALWWWSLAVAPLNMVTLFFVLQMLNPDIYSPIQAISNWLLGVAGLVLLLFIPYHLYGASQAIVGQSFRVSNALSEKRSSRKSEKKREEFREKRLRHDRKRARKRQRGSKSHENIFSRRK